MLGPSIIVPSARSGRGRARVRLKLQAEGGGVLGLSLTLLGDSLSKLELSQICLTVPKCRNRSGVCQSGAFLIGHVSNLFFNRKH
jgi:hypothetical protein